MASRAGFDTRRSLAFGGLSGSYASVGSATTRRLRAVCITNTTDIDVDVTTDATEDQLFVPADNFKLYDLQANAGPNDDAYVIPIGTQFSAKGTGASRGSIIIEGLY